MAGVELVDLVRAVARGLGAVADEDLDGSDNVSEPWWYIGTTMWSFHQEGTLRLTPPIWRFSTGLASGMAAVKRTARQTKRFILTARWDLV